MDFRAIGSPNVEVKADGESRDQTEKRFLQKRGENNASLTALVIAAHAEKSWGRRYFLPLQTPAPPLDDCEAASFYWLSLLLLPSFGLRIG